ncbi:MAG: signal recognition particle protein [Acidimicrobiia bacterium]|nr:signal recognition particle protein [Acidimicrobiia bacterium]MYD04207.1 signal recognition particle protein [Acidimicrobiia bacterium]
MFESLTARLESALGQVRGKVRLSSRLVDETLGEVRLALLEADVNVEVVNRLLGRIKKKSVGTEVQKSIVPGHKVIKIVHDCLVETLGTETVPLVVSAKKPQVTLVVGLQGSGKTTSAAKLAYHHQSSDRKVMLVAADLVRPGAVEQLMELGEGIGIPVFAGRDRNPVAVVRKALQQAGRTDVDSVVVDTAGRTQIDRALMTELGTIARVSDPDEVLLVLDAMTGQQAVAVAQGFQENINLTGVLLSKLDSDARGGAAISVREATGAPIKLVGTGERPGDLEVFHPDRMASRILGMGDIITFFEKAEQAMDAKRAEEMADRLIRNQFTFEDYIEQIKGMRKMGSSGELLGMIPGLRPAPADIQAVDQEIRRSEAIICSMTPSERTNPRIINGSRRQRIAKGSGTSVQDVAFLVKHFGRLRSVFQSLSTGGPGGAPPRLPKALTALSQGGLLGTLTAPGKGGQSRNRPRPAGNAKKPRTAKKRQKKKKR